ncbi:Zn-dependent hydrolase, glyoxylase [Desulfosporosinus orientis DSM 765]|uniref:Zn-dependent hydrolase, glyoxylase n=1 Tax=Desulfosporosinus orientis (strain ATCC 19365 / DSM 765 / NCIMB 8382 / VKM B-1628 / Singapore I) TaxID=768706 RepID=G7WHN1_DESOD|nr:MBL fold metallo-hydrolase [Desulfosporosinus orientis]AET70952.1 Zn-dependent hydrolase, glyoxylase [Desulfosporosinus orientis DSM 765]
MKYSDARESKETGGLRVLEISYMGRIINPVLIWDKERVILIDTGFPGQLPEIRSAVEAAGVPFSGLSHVVITHQDVDHIGALQEILKAAEHEIQVITHNEEKPFIEGVKRPLKMTKERLAAMFAHLPEEKREEASAKFLEVLKSPVNKTVEDGEVLPWCGGITVTHTPGHTPGHICLYLNQAKTLIAGDALNVLAGQLTGPNPEFTPDMETARKSLEKLIPFEIERVVCYHGGVFEDKVKERLLALVKG